MKIDAKAILTAVGEVLAEERARRIALEAKVDELAAEVEKLRRGAKRLKAVPPDAMIA